MLRQLRYQIEFIMHQYWPLSIFIPKIPAWQDLITLIAIIFFSVVILKLHQQKSSIVKMLPIIWLLVISTNLLQGFDQGLSLPTTSDNPYDSSYYQDARLITNPSNFLEHYITVQPFLGYHSRVHPPLPVLIHYSLNQITINPIFHSLTISLLSLISIWIVYKFTSLYTSTENARFVSLLFGLLPAYQIYSLASMDALIATVFIATLYSYTKSGKSVITHALLFVSALLTFGYIWLIPILYVITLITHKNVFKDFILLLMGNLLILFLFQIVTGYSYIASFKLATSFESTHFFFESLYTFLSYCVTRIQDVLEPIFFLGPIITLMLFKAFSWLQIHPVKIIKHLATATSISIQKIHIPGFIALAGLASFFGFIATGAYYTGETARAAFYLIPVIIISLGPFFDAIKMKPVHQHLLILALITQTTIMQLFGHFLW